MDANPSRKFSPQTVGNEFVRQYYTLLNKAPNQLHRFYNTYSSFTHGDSQLVVGQREIHNRIQQLHFKNCLAKITRVNSQGSSGDGVVVQVSGEMSNDGQPMRRFCQTFVLVAMGPKKYYVHNDILSYQDVGHAEKQDQIGEQLDNSEIQMGNQAVQVCEIFKLNKGKNDQDQNTEQVKEPGVQLVDQSDQKACKKVSLNRDITMEDEQDQNKEKAEEPGVQILNQTVKVKVSADQDLYKEDTQNQNEKPDIQMVDEAVQVACDMVSKYTQPKQVAPGKTSSAASQTIDFSLLAQHNSPQPQSIPNKELQKPGGTPAGFEVSPLFIQQQRQEQPPHTVIQKEQKESQPQKQLLFSESLGGQVTAAQTNTNNKMISIELDISIYLVDKP